MKFINKGKIILFICILIALVIAFFSGGNTWNSAKTEAPKNKTEAASHHTEESVDTLQTKEDKTQEPVKSAKTKPETDKTEDAAEGDAGVHASAEQKEADVANNTLTCTLSVRCDTVVGKENKKAAVIPNDGVVFAEQTVVFYAGESVFHVLVRELKKNKIHLEFVNVPIYNSAYIEGIQNIYEYDFGELSGWMYKVNDRFPNYGCSQYLLKPGDKIEWVYTCDLGADVGGKDSARNGM